MTDTGESAVEYVDDSDEGWADDWIHVPLDFPHELWRSPKAWASDIAAQRFSRGRERKQFARLALEVALALIADPPSDASGDADADPVFWYVPRDGGPHGFAHMTIADPDPEVSDAEGWATAGIDGSEAPAQVTRYRSEKVGEIVQVASTFRGDDQRVAGHLCTVAVGQAQVFYLETTSADFMQLDRMRPGLVGLVGMMRELELEELEELERERGVEGEV